ncbi:hypothetical protein JCM8097_000161 [Rhodosporidiobolus ruineniae]
MKGLTLDSLPSPGTQRTPAPSRRRFLALLALLPLACFLSTISPNTGLSTAGVGEMVREIKWALTPLPKDPRERAVRLMERQPVVDGHIDLPILARSYYANQINDPELDLRKPAKGEVDIPRLREGKVGGFFWSVFVPCPDDLGLPSDESSNFTASTPSVRDTLEQIDTARLLIDKYSDVFELTLTAADWKKAMKNGKVGGMLGVEGGHQLGTSLSSIRAYYALGARYITFTHTCNSPLGDSCGYMGSPVSPIWNGLSSFGRAAVGEMNRLGMLVDVSHTHPKTASDALSLSEAPVIFSHSNARGVHDVVRNVPDAILRRIGNIDERRRGTFNLSEDGEQGKGWGADNGEVDKEIPGGDTIIMLNFSPDFISEPAQRANVSLMADHADYIGRLAGREHVGIGSDFDGIGKTPEGLEDVSTYPNLVAELIKRGWSDKEIMGLTSGNILRILTKAEAVAHRLKHRQTATDIFKGRTDLAKHKKPPVALLSGGSEKQEKSEL